MNIGRDATHLIMDGGDYRNGLFRDVNVGEIVANLKHGGQSLHDRL